MDNVVVVGASLAGFRAVEELRHQGYDGRLTVIGAETHLPYDRPPLSKQVLSGKWELDRIALRPIGKEISELDVDWKLGVAATGLDLSTRDVELADGSKVPFDGLLIATGAAVRTLPGQPNLDGLYALRTLDDCLGLRRDLERTPERVVVVGAGFIGAEVAATARERGLEVTVLEALSTPLQRALGDQMGNVCADIHRDHGVDLRLEVGVEGFQDDGNGRFTGVTLTDGTTVAADVAVVGVGVVPNTGWLEGSGLTIDNGVVCDESCLAAEGVVAAGDIARWPNTRFGEVMRVEHWENAQDQGAHAARRLLGQSEPYAPVPWFWSDQYDRKIQLAGRSSADDEVRVVDGSIDERRFVAIYGRGERLVGVLGMNRPRVVMEYRQLIASGASWDDALAKASDT
ncbi:MAG TPA: FAD-dependent oxidoreductase [Acidimicrobiales bacterium]|nr:FAD-dependent oxidoreductase [Acidimicrobiales bacterium]